MDLGNLTGGGSKGELMVVPQPKKSFKDKHDYSSMLNRGIEALESGLNYLIKNRWVLPTLATVAAGAVVFGIWKADRIEKINKEFDRAYQTALISHGDANGDGEISYSERKAFDRGLFEGQEGVVFVNDGWPQCFRNICGPVYTGTNERVPKNTVTNIIKNKYKIK